MSSYSLWELNMQELIQDFTGDELTVATAEVLLKGIGFNEIEISHFQRVQRECFLCMQIQTTHLLPMI